jgi:hypothetical protein
MTNNRRSLHSDEWPDCNNLLKSSCISFNANSAVCIEITGRLKHNCQTLKCSLEWNGSEIKSRFLIWSLMSLMTFSHGTKEQKLSFRHERCTQMYGRPMSYFFKDTDFRGVFLSVWMTVGLRP